MLYKKNTKTQTAGHHDFSCRARSRAALANLKILSLARGFCDLESGTWPSVGPNPRANPGSLRVAGTLAASSES